MLEARTIFSSSIDDMNGSGFQAGFKKLNRQQIAFYVIMTALVLRKS